MKVSYSIFCLFIFSIFSLNSQNNNWLESQDYTYVTQSTVDYCFEERDLYDPSFNNYKNEQLRIKMDPDIVQTHNAWLEDDTWLWTVVLEKLKERNLIAYDTQTDSIIDPKVAINELIRTDTIVNCFPASAEEDGLLFITIYPDFMGWRLHLTWGWNDKLRRLESQLSAIAPVFRYYDENGNNESRYSPIYFKEIANIEEESPINELQWAWIGQAKVMFSWEQAEIIKGDSISQFVRNVLFQKALKDYSIPIYNTSSEWWSD
ncbi:MAG: hypothetical protein AAGJ93_08515, partial [Bacteroidota bacterium]